LKASPGRELLFNMSEKLSKEVYADLYSG